MGTRSKPRWNPSPEELAERKERDRKALAAADAILATPDGVQRLIERLMRTKLGPRVLKYSLRNQALVTAQCEERGIPLTDVAGRKTWWARGRKVRGPGLRITAANSRGDENADTPDNGDQPPKDERNRPAGDQEPEQVGFHMVSVWDLSQTEPVFEPKNPPDEDTVGDPAQILLENLTGQVTRRGYRIVEDSPDDPDRASNIDHEQRVIATAQWWSTRDRIVTLALALSQVMAAEAAAREERRKAREAKATTG